MGKIYASSPAIPLGPSSFPVFQNSEGVVKHCRRKGIHLHSYLDNCLQPSRYPVMSVSQRSTRDLYGFVPGISPNGDKSEIVPSQVFFSLSTFLTRGRNDRLFFGLAHENDIIDSENVIRVISISQTDPFTSGSNGVFDSIPAR